MKKSDKLHIYIVPSPQNAQGYAELHYFTPQSQSKDNKLDVDFIILSKSTWISHNSSWICCPYMYSVACCHSGLFYYTEVHMHYIAQVLKPEEHVYDRETTTLSAIGSLGALLY